LNDAAPGLRHTAPSVCVAIAACFLPARRGRSSAPDLQRSPGGHRPPYTADTVAADGLGERLVFDRCRRATRGRGRLGAAQIANVTNRANYGGFSGVMTSEFFRRATSVQNPRKIDLVMSLSFLRILLFEVLAWRYRTSLNGAVNGSAIDASGPTDTGTPAPVLKHVTAPLDDI
jgi:hypothetical protein